MKRQHPNARYGMTLVELLVVVSVTVGLFFVTTKLALQMGDIFANASPQVDAHQSNTLAFKRIHREIREARQVVSATASSFEFIIPEKTNDHQINQISATSAGLYLPPGKTVRYFLGVKQFPNPNTPETWVAQPASTGADLTLFRVETVAGVSSAPRILIEHLTANDSAPVFARVGSLLTVTLTIPVQQRTGGGRFNKNMVMKTRFYMRNLTGG